MNLEILFEDNHLIAVNKKSGDLVQGDKTGDKTLGDFIKEYLKIKYNKPGEVFLGTIHRIDRPVSGIVLYARTSKALERMNDQFRNREVQKVYWALVEKTPDPESGTLSDYLIKDQSKNKSRTTSTEQKGSLLSELSYKTIGLSDRYTLVEVYPDTGRHHQIRVQLSAAGSIIKGDLKYGAKRSNKDGSISLHARKLKFLHPVQKNEIEIIAPVPHDRLWEQMEKLHG